MSVLQAWPPAEHKALNPQVLGDIQKGSPGLLGSGGDSLASGSDCSQSNLSHHTCSNPHLVPILGRSHIPDPEVDLFTQDARDIEPGLGSRAQIFVLFT